MGSPDLDSQAAPELGSGLTTVWEETGDGRLIARLRGELALGYCGNLRKEIRQHTELAGQKVILDLTGVYFIDSAGISELVSLYKQYRLTGELSLVAPAGPVRSALERVQLTRLLSLFPSLEAALARPQ